MRSKQLLEDLKSFERTGTDYAAIIALRRPGVVEAGAER